MAATKGAFAADLTNRETAAVRSFTNSLASALSDRTWQRLETATDRALEWIAAQQKEDGSFPTTAAGNPAATSLAVLAFLSRGHQPGVGRYGAVMNRGIDFTLTCQRDDGLFSSAPPPPMHQDKSPSHAAVYNHAIAGLMLSEVYGQVSGERARRLKEAIQKGLAYSRELQVRPKAHAVDKGGWRYLHLRFSSAAADSDLSVTAWQLMFLRSAKNAEFNVPELYMNDATEFVRRCWQRDGTFQYALVGGDIKTSRGMVGAGILSLSLAGQHQTPMALAAGDWLISHPIRTFGETIGPGDRFFYSAYYCSQASAQLGGKYWERFFPPLVETLLQAQMPDGSWPVEPKNNDAVFGNLITTAMAVLALTPPYQLLPVYQR